MRLALALAAMTAILAGCSNSSAKETAEQVESDRAFAAATIDADEKRIHDLQDEVSQKEMEISRLRSENEMLQQQANH